MDGSIANYLSNIGPCPEKFNFPLLPEGQNGKVLRKDPSSSFWCDLPENLAILRTKDDKLQQNKIPREKGQLKQ